MDQTAELLNAWVESARDYAIFLIDPEGRVVSWNAGAERILGYSEAEVIGQPLDRFFTPDDIEKGVPAQEIAEARAKGRASDDRWHMRKDTSRFWCSGVLMLVRDDQGTARGFVKVMRDLTGPKLMEEHLRSRTEELLATDHRRNEFLAMLSHELRNPLAPILTSLYILRAQMPSNDPVVVEARDLIERQVTHMKRLIDDLLDVSRMALNRITLLKEPVDLRQVAAHAIQNLGAELSGRRHELIVEYGPEPVVLLADPVRLEQTIAALLSNAAKFTEPGGRIWLTTGRERDEACVRVRDSGVGIAPEMLKRAFDLFAQADQGLARSQGGLGIGLSLARDLVRLHGGTIEARSDGSGKGSEFIVRLPIPSTEEMPQSMERPQRTAAPSESASSSIAPDSAGCVLVVDDNRDAARSVELLVRQAGHDVLTAHDGPTALEIALSRQPDLIILDIGLPQIDGYAVARELRRKASIPIVALTGYAPEQSTSSLFDAYLRKPVQPGELLRVLEMLR